FGNFFHQASFLYKNNQDQDLRKYNELSDLITPTWTFFWIFNIAYIVFLFVFSLLSTSAVVYTVASIHTGKSIYVLVPNVCVVFFSI
ncbi:MAG: hypothetical protein Q8835_03375, partial [Sweet potato little leaf phytoplasma]|nr:hypothetical protein [Sweet potato little leaf phytoplasma]